MADEAAKREQAIADYRKRLLGEASAFVSRCLRIFMQRADFRCVQQFQQHRSLPATPLLCITKCTGRAVLS